jgi:protocatechuate 3,4-dioxygenase beta subunit
MKRIYWVVLLLLLAWPGLTAAQTPAAVCTGTATPDNTEGPYFKPGSPERASLLEAGVTGTTLVLSGQVLSTSCQPIAGALLDFWQADAGGRYDNTGFRLRGHQLTDAQGRYRLETVVPGLYPGRTRHIHVKVQAPGGPVLTTQLYFAGDAANTTDMFYRPELELTLQTTPAGQSATFSFVLNAP